MGEFSVEMRESFNHLRFRVKTDVEVGIGIGGFGLRILELSEREGCREGDRLSWWRLVLRDSDSWYLFYVFICPVSSS